MSKPLFIYRSREVAAQFRRNSLARTLRPGKGVPRPVWSAGVLYNPHAWWLGVHYSPACHRWCINILPCLTLWVRGFGGNEP